MARKQQHEDVTESSDRRPATKSDRTRAGMTLGSNKSGGMRARVSAKMMQIGFLRRRYIKRMLKYLDKSKANGKRLPPELYDLSRFLSQVPKAQRAQRLEEAMTSQGRRDEPLGNRDLRRASSNQQRQSGRGGGRSRPGLAPRSLQPGPRQPKKPR